MIIRRMFTVLLGLAWIASAPPAWAEGNSSLEVIQVIDDVEVRPETGDWEEAQVGQLLVQGDEISTGPDSSITLRFPDNTVLKVKELSQIRVGFLLKEPDGLRAEVQLKIGKVSAKVNPKKTSFTDFSIKSPIATASVRGTEINEVSYFPGSGFNADLKRGSMNIRSSLAEVDMAGKPDTTESTAEDVPPDQPQTDGLQCSVDANGFAIDPAGQKLRDRVFNGLPYGDTDEAYDGARDAFEPEGTRPANVGGGGMLPGGIDGGSTLIFKFFVEN